MKYFQLFCCKQGIELYLKTGMQLTRTGSPKRLRTIATYYTGKKYKSSRLGLMEALEDIKNLLEELKTQKQGV